MRYSKGIIFVETMIAATIVGVGFLGLVRLQVDFLQQTTIAKQRSEALNYATETLENLRGFSTVSAYNAIASGNDGISADNATYQRTWTVTNHTGYKNVRVTVQWVTPTNETLNVDLSTNIARYNPKETGFVMQ